MKMDYIRKITDYLIAPNANCLACKTALGANKAYLCPDCFSSLSPLYLTNAGTNKICVKCGSEIKGLRCACGGSLKKAFQAYSAYHFENPVSSLVKAFKYGHVTTLKGWMADEMTLALKGDRDFDIITAVPVHLLRRVRRGYNQSELLSKELSLRINIPFDVLLKKKRYTQSQAGLKGEKRRSNLLNAFICLEKDVKGKRILLVDDVRTTGSTLLACAKALMEAGCESVAFVTLCSGR